MKIGGEEWWCISIMLYHVVYIQKVMFSIFFISKDFISLQELCQIVLDRFARFGSPISHSIHSDIHREFMSLTCHTVLLPVIFAVLRVLHSIIGYDRYKRVIELDEFDLLKFENGEV
jgi:predicted CDP-diglyceride synthetase/phosphatidate cytidylyltransferase